MIAAAPMTRKNIPLCPKESAASRTRTAPAAARRHPPTHFSRLESLRYPFPITATARNAVKMDTKMAEDTPVVSKTARDAATSMTKGVKPPRAASRFRLIPIRVSRTASIARMTKNKTHKIQFPETPFHTELQEPSSRTPNTAAPPKRRSASAAAPQEESILPAIQVSAAARAKNIVCHKRLDAVQ